MALTGLEAKSRYNRYQLLYSIFCAILVSLLAMVGKEQFGTHHLAFHGVALGLYLGYLSFLGHGQTIQSGWTRPLLFPNHRTWVSVFVALGILSAVGRLVLYRVAGIGGIGFYARTFVPFLAAGQPLATFTRWAAFAVLLYGAALVPGLLLCGVIQESFRREGLLWMGLLMQAAVFGIVHLRMDGTVNVAYGLEAGIGGIIYGLGYYYTKGLHASALFLWINVFLCTLASFYRSF